jgi:putative glutamine amidotransferase
VWDQQAFLLPRNYVDAIQQAGGLALMVPVDSVLAEDPNEVLDLIDGLMLAGGADIDPSFYGAEPDPETVDTVAERDAFEIALARGAIARDLPLLGICRGMQLINVARGGTLLQHLPECFGHHEHRRVVGSFDGADHDVTLLEGSLAARAAGELRHATKSHHHQGVDRLGEGLRVSGRSTLDDLPEAIEWDGRSPAKRFLLGVQWHPEADAQSGIVGALVAAAGPRARARARMAPAIGMENLGGETERAGRETARVGGETDEAGDGIPHRATVGGAHPGDCDQRPRDH